MNPKVDTIVALATPPGRGGVAVIRVSGSHSKAIAETITRKQLIPRHATFSTFLDTHQHVLDEGLAIFFPGPHSFTGEDVLELQGHGGPIVVDCLIHRVLELGARLAKPGEFSERAFLNGKMDLVQAEAVADLIQASSKQAMRSAIRSLQGEFSKKITVLVETLIQTRLFLEAAIDFVEEEIDFLNNHQIEKKLSDMIHQFIAIETSAVQGSLLSEGITIVIAGEPNVGKSTLLNQLSGKEVAIVTDIPGTTRDLVREQILIDGMPIHFIDTAGIRNSVDPVEQEGIRRAKAEMAKADMVVFMTDASLSPPKKIELGMLPSLSVPILVIRNKIDLTHELPHVTQENDYTIISLSAQKKVGIDLLTAWIKQLAGYTATEDSFSARRRHLDALSRAKHFLLQGQQQLQEHNASELLAEDLRQAQLALSDITGEFTSDDLLGRIFSSFCIGK